MAQENSKIVELEQEIKIHPITYTTLGTPHIWSRKQLDLLTAQATFEDNFVSGIYMDTCCEELERRLEWLDGNKQLVDG